MKKMVIEVWSDIACPYCYLGKKRLEKALEEFGDRDKVEVVWKSYQLDPQLQTDGKTGIYAYLAARGYDAEQLKMSNAHLIEAGRVAGIDFHFEDIVVANTFHAHVLLKLAARKGLPSAAKERLMETYFTEGKNVDDPQVLKAIAVGLGLDPDALEEAFKSPEIDEEIRMDAYEAHQLGARGVPFFVFNDKYIVRGAQEKAVFSGALLKSYGEWENADPALSS